MKKISIALTTYNGEKYLEQLLESILVQTYPAEEIVVCDDCSTDATWEILQQYKGKYPGMFTIEKNSKTLGYIKNFEKVIRLCTGAYIALADQDDIWRKDKLEELLRRLSISGSDLIHSDAALINAQGMVIEQSYERYAGKQVKNSTFKNILFKNIVTGCTVMFKRSLIDNTNPFPTKISHDWWIALLAANKSGIGYVPEQLVYYRQHNSNALGAKSKDNDKSKENNSLLERQDKRHDRERNRYSELKSALQSMIDTDHHRLITQLESYHDSYFDKSIRIKAFYFHLKYIKQFSQGLSCTRSVKLLSLSIIGRTLLRKKYEK